MERWRTKKQGWQAELDLGKGVHPCVTLSRRFLSKSDFSLQLKGEMTTLNVNREDFRERTQYQKDEKRNKWKRFVELQ